MSVRRIICWAGTLGSDFDIRSRHSSLAGDHCRLAGSSYCGQQNLGKTVQMVRPEEPVFLLCVPILSCDGGTAYQSHRSRGSASAAWHIGLDYGSGSRGNDCGNAGQHHLPKEPTSETASALRLNYALAKSQPSLRDSSDFNAPHPALKRRAIFSCPFGAGF
jgi:hypothetical protein